MPDREKVVCAIENCIGQPKCKDCPWEDCEVEHEVVNRVPYGLLRDAIVLLKKQNSCENCAIAIEDRQPVVRCKDCKHWDSEDHVCEIKIGWFTCDADYFCADGERRETQ